MEKSIISEFYLNLKKGKIMGMQCRKCKHIMFPPKAACDKCGQHKMAWKKMSGDGKLLFFSSGNLPPPKFAQYHPYAYGGVQLKEGPVFYTQIQGVDVSNVGAIEKQNEMCPMKVKGKIVKMAGNNILVFKVVK
jgi:uncharacterized OB-fold protein